MQVWRWTRSVRPGGRGPRGGALPFARLASYALGVAVLTVACASDGADDAPLVGPPAPGPGDAATVTAADDSAAPDLDPAPPVRIVPGSFSLDVPDARWTDAATPPAGRVDHRALLIAADELGQRAFDLPHAARNLDAVRDALHHAGRLPLDHIRVLSGDDVTRDEVAATILELGRELNAPSSVLLVYYVGHGWVDGDGEPQLFTRFTREAGTGSWLLTMGRRELLGWMDAAAEDARSRGVDLAPALVVDACRTNVMSPPGGAHLQPAGAWELYGTTDGRFALAPDGDRLSPFTRAFVDGLSALAGLGDDASLRRVYEESRARMLADPDNAARQQPELVAPPQGPGPRLTAPAQLAFSVRAVDAFDGRLVEDLRVRVNAAPAVGGVQRVDLSAVPGRHELRVSADGYLTRVAAIELARTAPGELLEVPLVPHFVRIDGRVTPPSGVAVRVVGNRADLRDGVHVLSSPTDADGRFRLRVPELAEGLQLEIVRGERVLDRRDLPRHPSVAAADAQRGLARVDLVDLGALLLPSEAAHGTLHRLAAAEVTARLPLPEPWREQDVLPQPEGLDPATAARWQQVTALAETEPGAARAALEVLAERLAPGVVSAWNGALALRAARADADESTLVGLLEEAMPGQPTLAAALSAELIGRRLADLARRASEADAELPAALAELGALLPEGDDRYTRALRDAVRERQLALAARVVRGLSDARRWRDVLSVLVTAAHREPWTDGAWDEVRREVDVYAVEAELVAGLELGIAEGDWERADESLAWLDLHADGLSAGAHERLEVLRTRIGDQHIPLWAREQLHEAQTDVALGRYEKAERGFAALQGRLTPYYEALVASRRGELSRMLFDRLREEALAHEDDGRADLAAAAWGRALRHDARAADEIFRLGLPVPGVLLVSRDGRGLGLVSEALRVADVDDVIVVGPGVYDESLGLTGSRALHAARGHGEVVLRGRGGPAVAVSPGAEVTLSGFVLSREGSGVGAPEAASVLVDGARVRLQDCALVPAAGGSALRALRSTSAAWLELDRCRVRAGEGAGLVVADGTVVRLQACELDWSTGLDFAPLVGALDAEHSRIHTTRVGDEVFEVIEGAELATLPERLADAAARRHRSEGGPVLVASSELPAPYWVRSGITRFDDPAAALADVAAGGRVLLGPGTWTQTLRPLRSVTLEPWPDGEGDVIIRPDLGSALHLAGRMDVTVRGLQLFAGGGDQPTVLVERGSLRLIDCFVESGARGGPALDLAEAAGEVVVQGCEFPSSGGSALRLAAPTPVRVTDSQLSWSRGLDRALVEGPASTVVVERSMIGERRLAGPVRLDPERLAEVHAPARELGTAGGRRMFVGDAARPFWAVEGETHVATLTAALDQAAAGTTLVLQAGEHTGPLRPRRDVVLVGEGADVTRLVAEDASVLHVGDGVDVTVEALALVTRKTRPDLQPAVLVESGWLRATDAELRVEAAEGASLSLYHLKALGVFPAREATAEVELRRTWVASAGIGVDASSGARVRLQDCRVSGVEDGVGPGYGLWLTKGAHAEVFESEVRDARQAIRLEDGDTRLVLRDWRPVDCEDALVLLSAGEGQVEVQAGDEGGADDAASEPAVEESPEAAADADATAAPGADDDEPAPDPSTAESNGR